jgi:DNA-binding CsgD family transcriptional regulator
MTLPRSAADVLAGHVLFEIEAIDRMYLKPVPAAAAARCRDRRVLRGAPGPPFRFIGADGADDRGVHRGHPSLHCRSRTGAGAVRQGAAQGLQLTEAELRVALLAADGLTDREICGQLYLSQKTVELHLGRIHRKLGVRGRTELARRIPAVGNANFLLP